ncbi:MAG: hypothetical protein D6759_18760 [Chloroflexi bacterium]|nr:MAG: hypothetical protein D6759_18760 [Chloroflexota bacterium]
MSVPVVEKDEVKSLLLAIEGAARRLSEIAPTSPEVEFYLEGFRAALELVAVGLGVPLEFPRHTPSSKRLWQEVVTVFTSPDVQEPIPAEGDTSSPADGDSSP